MVCELYINEIIIKSRVLIFWYIGNDFRLGLII